MTDFLKDLTTKSKHTAAPRGGVKEVVTKRVTLNMTAGPFVLKSDNIKLGMDLRRQSEGYSSLYRSDLLVREEDIDVLIALLTAAKNHLSMQRR